MRDIASSFLRSETENTSTVLCSNDSTMHASVLIKAVKVTQGFLVMEDV